MTTIAAHVVKECFRRKVFLVVPILSAAFLALYAFGVSRAWAAAQGLGPGAPVDAQVLTGSTMLGLSMFATLFLGAVLATFLTFTVIRGDAEQGLLQPLLVRPLRRVEFLLGRYLGATAMAGAYVALLFAGCVAITGAVTDWWPDRFIEPLLQLVGAVAFMALISILGSFFFATVANGVAVMMVFGAGLTAGLLQQVGEALRSESLVGIGRNVSIALPFEGLYQAALHAVTADVAGVSGFVLRLGPFGGAQSLDAIHYAWFLLYGAGLLAVCAAAFGRRDI